MKVQIKCLSSITKLGYLDLTDSNYVSGERVYIPVEGKQIELKILCVGNTVFATIPHMEYLVTLKKADCFIQPDSSVE